MNMTGIIIAAAVVGIVGIVIGVLLGIASEKFKVEVDEKEFWFVQSFRATTAAAAVTQAVTLLQKQLQRARQRLTSVRSAALR